MAVAAVENSSFVAAENGSQFTFFDSSGLGCGIGGGVPCSMTLFFYTYSGNGTVVQCGDGDNPSSDRPIYVRDALAGLEVTFHTEEPASNSEVNGNTPWDLQDPTIQVMTPTQISLNYGFGCS
jgi:hypothetical protein